MAAKKPKKKPMAKKAKSAPKTMIAKPAKKVKSAPKTMIAKPAKSAGNDANLMSAVAHLGAVLFPVLLPIIMLLLKKDDARVTKQSKSALAFQIIEAVLLVGLIVVGTVMMLIPFIGWFIGVVLIIAASVVWLVMAAYGAFAAYKCWQGIDFEYPLIKKYVK